MPDGKVIIPNKKKNKVITAVDLFCGAGGTSTGLIEAVDALGYDIKLTAINHWDVAIATHEANHEKVIHHNTAIELVDPVAVVPGKRLQLLVASPECTHHSRARGGKPRSDQKRADAWLLMRWVEDLYIENILIENVKEFEEWGPLTAKGVPDKRYKGQYFQEFIRALRVNYTVDWKPINCANHGDPTTRERLFIMAKRGKGKKIVWPERTHASRKEIAKMALQPDMFTDNSALKPWVSARDKVIDWSLEGKSIFGRKKPLSPNTMKRIFAGLMKYSLKPFIVPQFSSPVTRDVNEPLGTVTTTSRGVGVVEADAFQVNLKGSTRRDRSIDEPAFTQATGNHQGLVEVDQYKWLRETYGEEAAEKAKGRDEKRLDRALDALCQSGDAFMIGQQSGATPRDVDEPVPTVAGKGAIGLVEAEPFLIKNFGDGSEAKYRSVSVDEPLGTVCAQRNHHGLVEIEPFILPVSHGKDQRTHSVEDPIKTVTAFDAMAICEPFVVEACHAGNENASSVDDPLKTVLGSNRFAVVEPFVISAGGPELGPQTVDEPMRTILTRDHQALVDAFLVKFHGGQGAENRTYPVDEPMKTLDTSNRFGLVETEPFVFNMAHTGNNDETMCKDVDDPLQTVAGKGMFGLVEAEPFIVATGHTSANGTNVRDIADPVPSVLASPRIGVCEPYVVNMKGKSTARSIDEPTFTQTGKQNQYLAEPYIVKFYGNGENADSVQDPLATVTAKDRFGLCIPSIGAVLDIRFRMLQPHELAAAMSFPKDYEFTGNREQKVKQIGNAVPLETAKALCRALLSN